MEVLFPPEIEAKVNQAAQQQGRRPDEVVQQLVAHHIDEDARLIQAVRLAEEALDRGEYLTHEEVCQRMERFLRP